MMTQIPTRYKLLGTINRCHIRYHHSDARGRVRLEWVDHNFSENTGSEGPKYLAKVTVT